MGVEHMIEQAFTQRMGHQGQGLLGVGAVAGVNQHGGLAVVQQHVVAGQPTALEHGDVAREKGAWSRAHVDSVPVLA